MSIASNNHQRLAIIGAGELGCQIVHHARTCGYQIAGFFDNHKSPGTLINSYEIFGTAEQIEPLYAQHKFDCLAIGIGYTHFAYRKEVFERFHGRIPFATIIHPAAMIDDSSVVGEGSVILAGTVVDMGVTIGQNTFINPGSNIAHDSIVGSHCFLGPAVTIAGRVRIGECCFLGVGTTVRDHLVLNDYCKTGAGAVVVKNITEPHVYHIGNPARKMTKP